MRKLRIGIARIETTCFTGLVKQRIKYRINSGIVWSGEDPDPHGYVWLADLNKSAGLKYLLAGHREIFRSIQKKHSPDEALRILRDKYRIEISKNGFSRLLKEMEACGLVSKL